MSTVGRGPAPSGTAKYDGTGVVPSPLVNVTDRSSGMRHRPAVSPTGRHGWCGRRNARTRSMSDRLAQHGGHDATGSPLDQLEPEAPPDAVAHVEELLDAEVVHQPQLVIRKRAPGVARGNRSRGLAAVRVALIHRDAAEVVLERFHRVEHRGGPVAHPRVQAPAGRDEQREARANRLVADANVTLFIERHGSPSW